MNPVQLLTDNVQDRDFRYVMPFLVQFGLYVSPVGFSSAIVPGEVAAALWAQPDGGRDRGVPLGFWLSMAIVALLLISGIRQFRRMDKRLAAVI